MPSDETRRVLKLFGVAVTNLEDARERGAPPEELRTLEADLGQRTREMLALVERLQGRRGP